MKIATLLVIAAVLAPACRAAGSPDAARPSGQLLSYKLMDLTGASAVTAQAFEIGLKPALDRMRAQGMPDELINSVHSESKRFFNENFDWEAVKPRIAKLYTDSFTDAELRDLVAFYQTPVGGRAATLIPLLTQQGVAMAMARIQANMPEFQNRVAALIQDFKKKANQAANARPQ